MSNPLSNAVLAFAKRPIGVLSIIGVALITLCCCTSGVLGSLLPDGSEPASTPSATRRATASASPSASPTPTVAPSPTAVAPAVVAPTTPAQPQPQPTKTSKSPKPSCHPNYSVCLPIVGDLDCGEISHKNFRVIGGRDPYGLDRDNDGIACEAN